MKADSPTLSRNRDGDFLLSQPGKPTEIVAKAFSPLWRALIDMRREIRDEPNPPASQLVLTGKQIHELNEFTDGDNEVEISIGFLLKGHSGPGLYAWATEYPEEGSIALFEVDTKQQQEAVQAAGVAAPEAFSGEWMAKPCRCGAGTRADCVANTCDKVRAAAGVPAPVETKLDQPMSQRKACRSDPSKECVFGPCYFGGPCHSAAEAGRNAGVKEAGK